MTSISDDDCEDQAFGRIEDGCVRWECQTWEGDKPVRPSLVKEERHGRLWWLCPKCKGSYGEVVA